VSSLRKRLHVPSGIDPDDAVPHDAPQRRASLLGLCADTDNDCAYVQRALRD